MTSINEQETIIYWHALTNEEIFKMLDTNQKGLSSTNIKKRLLKYGSNNLPIKKHPSFIKLFLLQFVHPIIFILIGATIASLAIDEIIDAIFILIVIMLNSLLGAYQEWNAERSASSLHSLLKINVRVRRSGKELEIDSAQLVPGDIVLIESGNKVAADIRLISAANLTVDESLLTGESSAHEKNINLVKEEANINEQTNICFAGSSVLSGRGVGVVIATALKTEVGKIANTVIHSKVTKPPLIIRMEKFTKQITVLVIALAIIFAIILYFKGYIPREIFFFVVALSVSAIPEGLPVALTVALSVATSRMLKRNVIVRKLTAVESLGSCNVIASDKTGTLTVNQQTAKIIKLPDGATFSVSGEGYNGIGKVEADNDLSKKKLSYEQLLHLSKISILTNEAALEKGDDEWWHHGDYIDVALLSLGYKLNLEPVKVRGEHSLIGMIPYESENKYSAVFFSKDEMNYVGIKGAVETVIDFCSHMATSSGIIPIDSDNIEQQTMQLSEAGYRVLGIATSSVDNFIEKEFYNEEDIPELIFLGLVAFIDPLRPESKTAVAKCHEAGIKVIMITGDHPATASSIAKELGILEEKGYAITGDELKSIKERNNDDFDKVIIESSVFARITPLQKLAIVESLKKQGKFVAVTGDGVNDAPALKSANIGVAMGSGTDVARETSSMIITDDNFLSIVAGVEEGRVAYDNVRKVIYLLISTGAAEVLLFILAVLTNLPLPLLAVQLLWLNLVTNGIEDIALAFEKGEKGIMKKKPRSPSERIFNTQMMQQVLVAGLVMGGIAFAVWYYLNTYLTIDVAHARNYILLLIVFMQNVHVYNCRSEYHSTFTIPIKRNIFLVFGGLLTLILHFLVTQVPLFNPILQTNPVTLKEILIILSLALPLLLAMEIFKVIKKYISKKIAVN